MSVFVAKVIVGLISLYLTGLGAIAMARSEAAKKYLLAHAGSPLAHYVEIFLRFVSGWALITWSPYMLASSLFQTLGWVVIVTTGVLFVLPWRLHNRFAQWSVPQATRHMKLIAASSMAGGLLMAYALIFGPAFVPAELMYGTAALK